MAWSARGKETQEQLKVRCRRFLKGEIAASEISQKELCQRLLTMGIDIGETGLSMKISRGNYPAWFLLAVLKAIGHESRISNIF